MKKFLLVLFLTAAPLSYAGEPDKELHEKCLYPTVLLWSDTNIGTGVIVKSEKVGDKYHNIVFTAAHVVISAQGKATSPYTVYLPKYKNWSENDGYFEFPTVIHRIDAATDTAVLSFESRFPRKYAEIDWKPQLFIGNSVVRFGAGMGKEIRLDTGQISSVNYNPEPSSPQAIYRTNIFTMPGDSGGPLYHENKLVGICHGIRSRIWNVNNTKIDVPIYNYSLYIPIRSFSPKDLEY